MREKRKEFNAKPRAESAESRNSIPVTAKMEAQAAAQARRKEAGARREGWKASSRVRVRASRPNDAAHILILGKRDGKFWGRVFGATPKTTRPRRVLPETSRRGRRRRRQRDTSSFAKRHRRTAPGVFERRAEPGDGLAQIIHVARRLIVLGDIALVPAIAQIPIR